MGGLIDRKDCGTPKLMGGGGCPSGVMGPANVLAVPPFSCSEGELLILCQESPV
jgi:hypothetical protein